MFLCCRLTLAYRFKVFHSSNIRDRPVAWACIRLDRLQPGYRCIDLMTPDTNKKCDGQLFVKIKKTVRA